MTGLKLYEKLQSQGTHCLYIWGQKMTKIKKYKKVTKNTANMQSFIIIGTKLKEELHSQEVPTVYI